MRNITSRHVYVFIVMCLRPGTIVDFSLHIRHKNVRISGREVFILFWIPWFSQYFHENS